MSVQISQATYLDVAGVSTALIASPPTAPPQTAELRRFPVLGVKLTTPQCSVVLRAGGFLPARDLLAFVAAAASMGHLDDDRVAARAPL